MPSKNMRNYGDRLGDSVEHGFYAYGQFVGRNPGKILIATVIFTFICAPGLGYIAINLDLYKLFVPQDAPVRFEFESQQAFQRINPGVLEKKLPVTTTPMSWNKKEENLPASSRLHEAITSENAVDLNYKSNNTIKLKRDLNTQSIFYFNVTFFLNM